MASRIVERIETPLNLAAVREVIPDAKTATEGIHRMMTERGFAVCTVVRMVKAYGGQLYEKQVKHYRAQTGIARVNKEVVRDYERLCSCCGLQPRKGRLLCSQCFSNAPTDAPGQQICIGPSITGHAAWAS